MAELAFQSDELDLTDVERESARHTYAQLRAGRLGGRPPTASGLIESIRRHGPDAGYLASALLLSLDEYRAVEQVYKDEQRKRRGWKPSR